jgi:hypothetical protein
MNFLHLFLLHQALEEHVFRAFAHELESILQLALIRGVSVWAGIFEKVNNLQSKFIPRWSS